MTGDDNGDATSSAPGVSSKGDNDVDAANDAAAAASGSTSGTGTGMKLSFALSSASSKSTKNKKLKGAATRPAFAGSSSGGGGGFLGDDDSDSDDDGSDNDNAVDNDPTTKEPLVIPCVEDSRKSLQEQARMKRDGGGAESGGADGGGEADETTNNHDTSTAAASLSKEDQDAIDALKADGVVSSSSLASGENSKDMIIKSSDDTFQRGGAGSNETTETEDQQFQKELDNLAPTLSVESKAYKQVPISQFGAAMLRGMGWKGNDDSSGRNNKDRDKQPPPADETIMPRPSRLGLGATPKIMDSNGGNNDMMATHSKKRRPLRQDELQKQERLKRQQEEFERNRQRQIQLDKQQTLQIGSIVWIRPDDDNDNEGRRQQRAMIKKLQGVPGLNMILVQFDGDESPSKIKKGRMDGFVDRSNLHDNPFQDLSTIKEQQLPPVKNDDYGGGRGRRDDSSDRDRDQGRDQDEKKKKKDDRKKDRERDRDRHRDDDHDPRRRHDHDHDHDRHRDRDRDRDRDRGRDRKRDRDRSSDTKSQSKNKRQKETSGDSQQPPPPSQTWIIPNIRVRIISSKYGKRLYKEKCVVVDVTRDGKATLKLATGGGGGHSSEVVHVPERHLETALPKVGGNACILSGPNRFLKGRLLERDSKANRGVVQLYEDMNVVTMSLDDMAEWCGPLDDDLADADF